MSVRACIMPVTIVAVRVTVAQSVKKKTEKSRIYANNGNNFIITKTYCFFLLQVSTWFQNHRRLERAKSYTPGQYALTEATD